MIKGSSTVRGNVIEEFLIPEDKYVEVDSITTRYWELGQEGPKVLLLHGIGGFAENWRHNIEAFARNFHLYVVDIPGFGKSDKPQVSYTFDFFSRFVLRLMQKLQIDRSILIGHSMGGGIALRIAIDAPEKAVKLVLVSSAGLGKEISSIFKMMSLPLFGKLMTKPSREHTEKLFNRLVYDKSILSEEMIDLAYRMSSSPGARRAFLKTARRNVNLLGARPAEIDPIRNNLRSIKAPTLLFWGKQDRILPVKHAYFADKKIPHSELVVFDRCGHTAMVERADEFNSRTIDFLTN